MNNKRKKELQQRYEEIGRRIQTEGFLEREYSSKEDKRRTLRKMISEELGIHVEFINIHEKRVGKGIALNIVVEEPVYLK
jgi:hypothetical protein